MVDKYDLDNNGLLARTLKTTASTVSFSGEQTSDP
jgi:hypothetical protein